MATHAMPVPRSGCFTISAVNINVTTPAGISVCLQSVIDLIAALQPECQEQNNARLGQLRGLKRKAAELDPAMRVVRTIEEEDCDQQHQRDRRAA